MVILQCEKMDDQIGMKSRVLNVSVKKIPEYVTKDKLDSRLLRHMGAIVRVLGRGDRYFWGLFPSGPTFYNPFILPTFLFAVVHKLITHLNE